MREWVARGLLEERAFQERGGNPVDPLLDAERPLIHAGQLLVQLGEDLVRDVDERRELAQRIAERHVGQRLELIVRHRDGRGGRVRLQRQLGRAGDLTPRSNLLSSRSIRSRRSAASSASLADVFTPSPDFCDFSIMLQARSTNAGTVSSFSCFGISTSVQLTSAFLAVSYDSSNRSRTARSRSFVSSSSSRLIPPESLGGHRKNFRAGKEIVLVAGRAATGMFSWFAFRALLSTLGRQWASPWLVLVLLLVLRLLLLLLAVPIRARVWAAEERIHKIPRQVGRQVSGQVAPVVVLLRVRVPNVDLVAVDPIERFEHVLVVQVLEQSISVGSDTTVVKLGQHVRHQEDGAENDLGRWFKPFVLQPELVHLPVGGEQIVQAAARRVKVTLGALGGESLQPAQLRLLAQLAQLQQHVRIEAVERLLDCVRLVVRSAGAHTAPIQLLVVQCVQIARQLAGMVPGAGHVRWMHRAHQHAQLGWTVHGKATVAARFYR
uniref:Uncharacterized protein n=1 Tax=Anopheles coluzzii TaxID=1518534 RepID=A0A8W7PM68_ANOCL